VPDRPFPAPVAACHKGADRRGVIEAGNLEGHWPARPCGHREPYASADAGIHWPVKLALFESGTRGELFDPCCKGIRVELDRSTPADWVGQTSGLFEPPPEALRRHVMAAKKPACA
jgi:hypothetical protein